MLNKGELEECLILLSCFTATAIGNINDLKKIPDTKTTIALKKINCLIQEYFKLKEKYSKILDDVHDYRYETHAMKMIIRNLCEHFGVKNEKELQKIYLNKPYTLKSLRQEEPVWDKTWGCWRYVLQKDFFRKGFYDSINDKWVNFEENRFYPPNKANEGK